MSGSRLSKAEASRIRSAIDRLSPKSRPTWTTIVEIAKGVTGREFTRQALSEHGSIEGAYKRRVEAYRQLKATGHNEKTGVLESQSDRRLRLMQEENESLRRTIAEYDRRWNAMFAHLHHHGMDARNIPVLLPFIRRDGR